MMIDDKEILRKMDALAKRSDFLADELIDLTKKVKAIAEVVDRLCDAHNENCESGDQEDECII